MRLVEFDNAWYKPGRSVAVRCLWMGLAGPMVELGFLPGSVWRRWILEWFGAEIGRGVVIKPRVRIKYPWHLRIGRDSWIGEDVWIDNLGDVSIGDDACISQGAYLCTGNHDYKDPRFSLMVGDIVVGHGAWVGARCSIGPGVSIGDGAIAAFGSTVVRDVPAWEIHAGSPAVLVRLRELREEV